ncbi:hypothetical protein JW968_01495 [Candidatus Woesearchaeota archaeon]|nr:hypothetical protein [Candidatus Woesearchaeota archaeon]
MDEDYDLVPHEEIIKLRKEVEELKKNPLAGTDSGKKLMGSINDLTLSLNAMMNLFKQASDEMKIEERESQIVAKKIEPLYDKLDELMGTNEKIAKGILTMANMLKEFMDKSKAPRPAASKPQPSFDTGPSSMSSFGPTAPAHPSPRPDMYGPEPMSAMPMGGLSSRPSSPPGYPSQPMPMGSGMQMEPSRMQMNQPGQAPQGFGQMSQPPMGAPGARPMPEKLPPLIKPQEKKGGFFNFK